MFDWQDVCPMCFALYDEAYDYHLCAECNSEACDVDLIAVQDFLDKFTIENLLVIKTNITNQTKLRQEYREMLCQRVDRLIEIKRNYWQQASYVQGGKFICEQNSYRFDIIKLPERHVIIFTDLNGNTGKSITNAAEQVVKAFQETQPKYNQNTIFVERYEVRPNELDQIFVGSSVTWKRLESEFADYLVSVLQQVKN